MAFGQVRRRWAGGQERDNLQQARPLAVAMVGPGPSRTYFYGLLVELAGFGVGNALFGIRMDNRGHRRGCNEMGTVSGDVYHDLKLWGRPNFNIIKTQPPSYAIIMPLSHSVRADPSQTITNFLPPPFLILFDYCISEGLPWLSEPLCLFADGKRYLGGLATAFFDVCYFLKPCDCSSESCFFSSTLFSCWQDVFEEEELSVFMEYSGVFSTQCLVSLICLSLA